jgi:hypothetical protein
MLPYSNCVHYDAEPTRRAEYHRFVGDGMRPGFAAEDGVALHFRRTRLKHAVSSRPDGCAYRVEHIGGGVVETPLKVSYLGETPAAGPTVGDATAPVAGQAQGARRARPRRRGARRAGAAAAVAVAGELVPGAPEPVSA